MARRPPARPAMPTPCNRHPYPTRRCNRRAFSILEMLVVVLLVGVLVSIVFVALGDSKKSAQSGACLSQLRQLVGGLRQYALNHRNVLPDPVATGTPWAQAIQPYIGAGSSFACPADTEVFPLTGNSYDWRDTGDPATTMAGRKLEGPLRSSIVMTFESLPGWHAAKRINTAWIDGSTHPMDQADCFKDLVTPVRSSGTTTP